jgi:hypothetical protein
VPWLTSSRRDSDTELPEPGSMVLAASVPRTVLPEPVIEPPVQENEPETSSSPAPVSDPPLNIREVTLEASEESVSSSEPLEISSVPSS